MPRAGAAPAYRGRRMRRTAGLIGMVALIAVTSDAWATVPHQAIPGTVAVGARTADPEGGPDWAVRSWRPRPSRGERGARTVRCAQVGRLADGDLVRRFAGGRERLLRLGERTVCGSLEDLDYFPLVLERLVDDPRGPDPRPVRTVIGGLAPRTVERVVLTVRGATRRLAVDDTRAFLAVLPGDIRRVDLALRLEGERGRRVLEFRSGAGVGGRIEEGSVVTELTVPNPQGGRPLALVGYAWRVKTVRGPRSERCTEPARVVAGEVGPYEPRWGSFLDAPSLVGSPWFEGAWAPLAPPATTIGSCTYALDPFADGPIAAIGVKRFARGLAIVHGILAPDVERLEVAGPGAARPAPAVAASGAFLVPVAASWRLGERVRLRAHLRDGQTHSGSVALGPQDRHVRWRRWRPLRDGRILEVHWIGGFEPFSGVQVHEGRRRVRVRLLERFPPAFDPAGVPYGSAAIAISKCVRFRLQAPLGSRQVVDRTTGRPRPRADSSPRAARRCHRARPRPIDSR
jgi:hypothetical protein